jgi:hypothetical protein
MQNVPWRCNAKNDSNSYQTFHGTPMVGTVSMDSTLSVMVCSKRRPWFPKFRTKLGQCATLDEIEALLRVKARRWRGPAGLSVAQSRIEDGEIIDEDSDLQAEGVDLTCPADDNSPDSYSMLELEK